MIQELPLRRRSHVEGIDPGRGATEPAAVAGRGSWLVCGHDRSQCLSRGVIVDSELAISRPPNTDLRRRATVVPGRERVFRKDVHQKTSPQPLALARRCCDINELDNKRLAVSRVELELIGGKLNPPGSLEHLISKPIKRQTPAPRLE